MFHDPAVLSYCSITGITWKWIVERAPWRGGAYEKMVDLSKRSLRVMIGRRLLPRDLYDTLIKEAAAIINSRPLSYLYEGPGEPLPIRPMDFLQPWGGGQAIAGPAEEGHLNKLERSKQDVPGPLWTWLNQRLEHLWEYWRDEYLAWTRESSKGRQENQTQIRSDGDAWGQP